MPRNESRRTPRTIFKDDADRKRFRETLAEDGAKTARQVHGYSPLADRIRLVVETPQANPVAGMKWVPGTCPSRSSES